MLWKVVFYFFAGQAKSAEKKKVLFLSEAKTADQTGSEFDGLGLIWRKLIPRVALVSMQSVGNRDYGFL